MFDISEVIIRLKEELDYTKIQLNKVIAKEKIKFLENEAKISEARLLSLVKGTKSYIEAAEYVGGAAKDLARYEALYEAFKERSSMIRKLADIYVANYYQSDSAGHSADDKRRKQRARRN
jgi:hypothetical protein